MKAHREESIQISLCKHLDLKYPDVIYTSDLSGIKLSIGAATKAKKIRCKRFKIPDLLILYPNNGYNGLIIELKASRGDLYLKSGEIANNKHVLAQRQSIDRLSELGYKAVFCCGLDEAIKTVDEYFK